MNNDEKFTTLSVSRLGFRQEYYRNYPSKVKDLPNYLMLRSRAKHGVSKHGKQHD
jgi:hypothetical protein